MASASRFFKITKLIGCQVSKTPIRQQVFPRNVLVQQVRPISTSKKDRDVALDEPLITPPLKDLKNAKQTVKDWQSYGYDWEDETKDLNMFHETLFCYVSMLCVSIVFYWMYFPDYMENDWIQRQAYLQIREREAAGLPHVDPNYVDPATLILPSEQEVEEQNIEIII